MYNCRHCQERIVREWITLSGIGVWNWKHANGRYACLVLSNAYYAEPDDGKEKPVPVFDGIDREFLRYMRIEA